MELPYAASAVAWNQLPRCQGRLLSLTLFNMQ
jgi:hypothetical protein